MQQKNENIKTLVALKLELDHANQKVRMQAARELSKIVTCEAVDAMIARLEREQIPAVRKVVSRALSKMNVTHVLVALSRSKIDFRRNLSVQWLQKFGRRHLDELLAIIKGQDAVCVDIRELIVTMAAELAGARGEEFIKLALESSEEALVIAGAQMARKLKKDSMLPIMAKTFAQWSEKAEIEEIRNLLRKLAIDPEDMADLAEFERKLIQVFNMQSSQVSVSQPSIPADPRKVFSGSLDHGG